MINICNIHNKTEDVNVSIGLKKILKEGGVRNQDKMIKVLVFKVEDGKRLNKYTYFILVRECVYLKVGEGCDVIELLDRDKERKELNDRILIVDIKRNLSPVCEDCFKNLLSIMQVQSRPSVL